MTGSSKFAWGLIINLVAGLVMLAGFGLTASVIGGCVGIPMIVAAFPFLIWGAIWIYQGQHLKAQETIALGVERGLTGAIALASLPKTPTGSEPPLATLPSARPAQDVVTDRATEERQRPTTEFGNNTEDQQLP